MHDVRSDPSDMTREVVPYRRIVEVRRRGPSDVRTDADPPDAHPGVIGLVPCHSAGQVAEPSRIHRDVMPSLGDASSYSLRLQCTSADEVRRVVR